MSAVPPVLYSTATVDGKVRALSVVTNPDGHVSYKCGGKYISKARFDIARTTGVLPIQKIADDLPIGRPNKKMNLKDATWEYRVGTTVVSRELYKRACNEARKNAQAFDQTPRMGFGPNGGAWFRRGNKNISLLEYIQSFFPAFSANVASLIQTSSGSTYVLCLKKEGDRYDDYELNGARVERRKFCQAIWEIVQDLKKSATKGEEMSEEEEGTD